MSLLDTRLPVLHATFFTSCEAVEFAETEHRQDVYPDLLILFQP